MKFICQGSVIGYHLVSRFDTLACIHSFESSAYSNATIHFSHKPVSVGGVYEKNVSVSQIGRSMKIYFPMQGVYKYIWLTEGGLGNILRFSKISTHPPPAYIKWTFPYNHSKYSMFSYSFSLVAEWCCHLLNAVQTPTRGIVLIMDIF